MTASEEAIAADLRHVLAEVTGRSELADVPLQTPLFGAGVGLDSLAGTLLLRQVQHHRSGSWKHPGRGRLLSR